MSCYLIVMPIIVDTAYLAEELSKTSTVFVGLPSGTEDGEVISKLKELNISFIGIVKEVTEKRAGPYSTRYFFIKVDTFLH